MMSVIRTKKTNTSESGEEGVIEKGDGCNIESSNNVSFNSVGGSIENSNSLNSNSESVISESVISESGSSENSNSLNSNNKMSNNVDECKNEDDYVLERKELIEDEVIYKSLSESGCTVIESCCMKCYENGQTRILLSSIPFFKEIVVMSFECSHCGYKNNEIQSGAALQKEGIIIQLIVSDIEDLNRQIIKSEYASFKIEDIDFEIPANTQKGCCSTIEGIISTASSKLTIDQKERFIQDVDIATKIQNIINILNDFASGNKLPFTVILKDPSGNSFIQKLKFEENDYKIKTTYYKRTKDDLTEMGYYSLEDSETKNDIIIEEKAQIEEKNASTIPQYLYCSKLNLNKYLEENQFFDDKNELIRFQVDCHSCGRSGKQNMCQIDIPGFRNCIIMAFVCDFCGAKENEVKPSGSYGEKGKKWILEVKTENDKNRDILKSDTATINIPSLDFEMCRGTQGGVFTTIEGLLKKTAQNLEDLHPFETGDSSNNEIKKYYQNTINGLRRLAHDNSALPFTFIMDDIADLSYIGEDNFSKNDKIEENDKRLTIEVYNRNDEQNDDLGLLDMKTENYE